MPSHIEIYHHGNRLGVEVELHCEDASTLRTNTFRLFAYELALHIAASTGSEIPLNHQPFFSNGKDTVRDRVSSIGEELGVPISITKYESYSLQGSG